MITLKNYYLFNLIQQSRTYYYFYHLTKENISHVFKSHTLFFAG